MIEYTITHTAPHWPEGQQETAVLRFRRDAAAQAFKQAIYDACNSLGIRDTRKAWQGYELGERIRAGTMHACAWMARGHTVTFNKRNTKKD